MRAISRSQWAVVAAFVATVFMNYLATSLPLGGKTTRELSDQYPVLITPAGYAFAIWGLIYLALLLFSGYQLLPAKRDNPLLQEIRGPFLLSSLANMSWIVFWHYELVPLSLLAMLVLLGTLLTIFRRIQRRNDSLSSINNWLVRRPFSLYLGWITVASVINVAVTLYDAGWRGEPIAPTAWAVLLMAVVALLGSWVTWRALDPVYGGVLVWALVGIIVKPDVLSAVALAAGAAALLIAAALLRAALRLASSPALRTA